MHACQYHVKSTDGVEMCSLVSVLCCKEIGPVTELLGTKLSSRLS
jgi:hypothetical protein